MKNLNKEQTKRIEAAAEEIRAYHEEGDYIEDAIHEVADSLVDVYNTDLISWAGTGQGNDYTEEALADFGFEGVGGTLLGAYRAGQFIMYEGALREELEDLIG